jgi:nicotinamide mononucleotide transporter
MADPVLTQLWQGLAATTPAEWVADVTGALYALLVMWHRRAGWLFGAVSSLILAVLAWRARLPMQALLQLSYVAAAGYGWWSWARPAAARPIAMWHWRGHAIALVASVAASLLLARLLAEESAFPFIDSLVACAGIFATWLLARVYLENWLYWIVIDTVSVYLFFSQGLIAVALLYVLYLGIAVVGFYRWWKTWRQAPAAA